jgi:RNA polymerase sigma factor (sigma-70 family)
MPRPSPRNCETVAPKKQWFKRGGRYRTLSKEQERDSLTRFNLARAELRILVESSPLTVNFLDTLWSVDIVEPADCDVNGKLQKNDDPYSKSYSRLRLKLSKLREEFFELSRYAQAQKPTACSARRLKTISKSLTKELAKMQFTEHSVHSIGAFIQSLHEEGMHLRMKMSQGRLEMSGCEEFEARHTTSLDYLKTFSLKVQTQLDKMSAATNEIIEHCIPMVIRIAGNYHRHDFQLDDLVQEGMMGVLIALERFDLGRGVRFKTYANYWVRQSVGRSVLDRGRKIRVPRHAMGMYSKVMKTRNYLSERSDDVLAKDISGVLRVPLQSVERALNMVQQPLSLDVALGGGEGGTIADFLSDGEAFDPEEETMFHLLSDEIKEVLAELPEREARIIRMRYGFGEPKQYTLRELGDVMGISRERVRQLEQQALGRIRTSPHIGNLRELLGTERPHEGPSDTETLGVTKQS